MIRHLLTGQAVSADGATNQGIDVYREPGTLWFYLGYRGWRVHVGLTLYPRPWEFSRRRYDGYGQAMLLCGPLFVLVSRWAPSLWRVLP